MGSSQPSDSGLEAVLATRMGIVSRVGWVRRRLGAWSSSPQSSPHDRAHRRALILVPRKDVPGATRIAPFSTCVDSPPQPIGRPQSSNEASAGQTTLPDLDLPSCEAHA